MMAVSVLLAACAKLALLKLLHKVLRFGVLLEEIH